MSGSSGAGTLMQLTAGSATLLAISLHGEESLSEPYLYVVEAVASTADLAPDDFLYKPASVKVTLASGGTRYIHGMVRRFTRGDVHGASWHYILEIVPKIWFAGQSGDTRVFLKKKVKDIITTVLESCGISGSDISWNIAGSDSNADDPERPFTIQYNETNLDFVTRLMEEAGFFYFHTHAESAHTLVIANNNGAFSALDGSYLVTPHAGVENGLNRWRASDGTATGKITLNDYDPLNPGTAVTNNTSTVLTAAGASTRNLVFHPALTDKSDIALKKAKLRMQAEEVQAHLTQADGHDFRFFAGAKFTVDETQWNATGTGDYVVRSVVHDAVDLAQATGGGGVTYVNHFTAFPHATPWREKLETKRPHLGGIYTAIVIGAAGDEINTDENGCIQVKLHWDYNGDETADATIYARVTQPWAGNGWGFQFIPRIGDEVAVAFVNGDPDHPIVIGSLYNGTQKVPFALTDKKNVSGIKTRSTTKGGAADFNELSFDDTKGSEIFNMHAQKDLTVTVENDAVVDIGHDNKITVKNDRTTEITDGNELLTVKTGNMTVNVDTGNYALTVKTGNWDTDVKTGNMSTVVDTGNMSTQVKTGNVDTKVDMGNMTTALSMGNYTVKCDLGKVSIEAMQEITLKVGGSTVKIDQMGVTIQGMMTKLEGQLQTDVKGLMTNVKADVMLQAGGAITMIG